MSNLKEFLMSGQVGHEVTKEVTISGFPYPFVIRSISEGQNKEIQAKATTITWDKKTREKSKEVNTSRYNSLLIEACVVEPNLKDAELQEHFGVQGVQDLLNKIFTPGQFVDLLSEVLEINGFLGMEDAVEEAKN